MNYYSFHLGDYAAHTKHLSLLEDLAYRRMLDLYYTNEAPLPSDPERIARLIGMRDHLKEVSDVLSDFFVKSDEGYRSSRCDKEIEAYKAKADRAKAANKSRWSADKSESNLKSETTSDMKSERNHVPTNNQEPITKNHKPLKTKNTTPPAVAAAPKFDFAKALADRGVPEHLIAAWLHVRKTKRAVNTEIAFDGFMREVQKSGRPLSEVVETCIKRSWSGFEVDWLGSKGQISNPAPAVSSLGKHGDATAENARAWLQQSGGVPA